MSYKDRANKTKEKQRELDAAISSGSVVTEKEPEDTTAAKRPVGRPRKEGIQREPGAKQGLQQGRERFTVIAKSSDVKFLKDLAYTERISIMKALARVIKFYRDSHPELALLSKPADDEDDE